MIKSFVNDDIEPIDQNTKQSCSINENVEKICNTDSKLSSNYTNSYDEEWSRLFGKNNLSMKSLRSIGVLGELRNCRFRSICWRLYLGLLSDNNYSWSNEVTKERQIYASLRDKYIIDPRQPSIMQDDPLSTNSDSAWNKFFHDQDLIKIIRQDVVRTFPEIEFFQSSTVRQSMINVLFCYSQTSSLSYRQGMHEVLGPLIFVLHCDHLAWQHSCELSSLNHLMSSIAGVVLDDVYLEHDSYSMFARLMTVIGPWYESRVDDTQWCYNRLFDKSGSNQILSTFPFKNGKLATSSTQDKLVMSNIGEQIADSAIGEQLTHFVVGEQLATSAIGEQFVSPVMGEQLACSAIGEQLANTPMREQLINPAMGEQFAHFHLGKKSTNTPIGEQIVNSPIIEQLPHTIIKRLSSCPANSSHSLPARRRVTRADPRPFARDNAVTTLASSSYIGQRLATIHNNVLKRQDLDLYLHLEQLEISPQMFGLRWLRLLFGREFTLQDLLMVWDVLFAVDEHLSLVDHIYVAMLVNIRECLLASDFATCLTYLMRYPTNIDITHILYLALHIYDPVKYDKPANRVTSSPSRVLSVSDTGKQSHRKNTITGIESFANKLSDLVTRKASDVSSDMANGNYVDINMCTNQNANVVSQCIAQLDGAIASIQINQLDHALVTIRQARQMLAQSLLRPSMRDKHRTNGYYITQVDYTHQ